MTKRIPAILIAVLCLTPLTGAADSGHLHSAIPVLEKLTEDPDNATMLGELRFLTGAIEDSPENRQVKAALMAVIACGRLQAGLHAEGLEVCRKLKANYGNTDFARLVDPVRLSEPGQPDTVSSQNVERQYKQVLQNATALIAKTVKQNKVAKLQVKALIAKSNFRKAGEKDTEPQPFVPAVLAESRKETESYAVPSRSKANLFDGLVLLCKRKQLDLSVDPEVLPTLARLEADLPNLAATEDFTTLEALLSQHSLLVSEAEVAPGRKTAFITTPSLWTYSTACRLLQDNDLAGSYRTLNEGATDTTPFAEHVTELKDTLISTARNRKNLKTMTKKVRGALDAYRRALNASKSPKPAAGLERQDGRAPAVASGAAKQSLDRASRQLEEVKQEFENVLRTIGEGNLVMVERFNETFDARLYTEAALILDYLVETQRVIGEILQVLRDNKISVSADWFGKGKGEVPEEILGARSTLTDIVKRADTRISAAQPLLESNLAKATELFSAAFHEDRVNLEARVGVGYCAIRHHTVALAEVFDKNWADDELAARLASENRGRRKQGFLQAMNFVTYGDTPPPAGSPEGAKQSAVGTSMAAAPGAILPLTVRLESRRTSRRRRPPVKQDPYWKNLQLARIDERDLAAEGITLGGQQKYDPRLLAALQDVHKWLKWTFGKAVKGKGLHVELTPPDGPEPNHSLGLPTALGGYSCVTNTSLRQDVASAGALQPDGSVRAIGGVHDRVAGAVKADRIEVLLLPRAVEANLLFVPIDHLCRVTIVTADQVGALKKHAFDSTYRAEAMESLREAQVLTLLGQYEAAREILQDIAGSYPEMYTARRLLELIALYQRD